MYHLYAITVKITFFHLIIPIVLTQNPLFLPYPQAVQASPTDVSRADEVQNRGTIAETAKEKLWLVIDFLIEKASDILKLAEDLTEKLKAGALVATNKINDSLQKILDKVSRLEDMVKDEATFFDSFMILFYDQIT